MKSRGKTGRVQVASGRDPGNGLTTMERHHYHFAVLVEAHDSLKLRSWRNWPQEAWSEEGLTARVLELVQAFRNSGQRVALITLSKAATHTAGLQLIPLNPVELKKFYQRHPRPTLKVITALTDQPTAQEPRFYVGTTPGGDGFCTDDTRSDA